MKFQVMEAKQKLPSKLHEGDFMTYQVTEKDELTVLMIALIKPNEYRIINMETGLAGSIFRPSIRELVKEYTDFSNFKYYSREKYTLNMVLEETK